MGPLIPATHLFSPEAGKEKTEGRMATGDPEGLIAERRRSDGEKKRGRKRGWRTPLRFGAPENREVRRLSSSPRDYKFEERERPGWTDATQRFQRNELFTSPRTRKLVRHYAAQN